MAPKTPKGELSATELRKLIRAHNILSKITVPKGTDRLGLIKIIEDRRFKINHKLKRIEPKPTRGNIITLKKAEEITKPKPVAESVKKQRAEKKKQQEEEKQKEIKLAKKEAVKEFKSKKKEALILKNKKKLVKDSSGNKSSDKMKKEDEVRPVEKSVRPKVDPKKIKVIEPKKKEEPKKVDSVFLKEFANSIYNMFRDFLESPEIKGKVNTEGAVNEAFNEFITEESDPWKVGFEKYYTGMSDTEINKFHNVDLGKKFWNKIK